MATVVMPLDLVRWDAHPSVPTPTGVLEYSAAGGVVASAFPVPTLDFADSVLSAAYWRVTPAAVGTTPALTLIIDWYHPTYNTASNVLWGVQVAAIAANAVVLNEAMATGTTASGAVSTTLGGRVRTSIAITANNDGFAAALQPLFVKVYRDGTSTSDTAVGNARVFGLAVSYADT